MESLKKRIEQVHGEIGTTFKHVRSEKELEDARVRFLGRAGILAELMAQLKALSVEQKRECGPLMNSLRDFAQQTYEDKKQELGSTILQEQASRTQHFDVTAYLHPELRGSLHVYTRIIEQYEDIFVSMGYQIADGPELESEHYNFDALNIPAEHPARDMFDTFWISNMPHHLLRTHTSPVQIRALEAQGAPLALATTGRVYRHEAVDATHGFAFYQYEGLFVDTNVSIAHLLATLQTFLRKFFEKESLNIRVRPGYFPFVEPGLEIDASCPFCTRGCGTCKKTGWIELLGAGLVHPNVLKASGIDPHKYRGFAFGGGLERLAMVKYGIPDIRLFHSGKIETLAQ